MSQAQLDSYRLELRYSKARVATLERTLDILRAEVRAWRDWDEHCGVKPLEECECDDVPRGRNLINARAATDAAKALEDNA
jgi:hypothetical protein